MGEETNYWIVEIYNGETANVSVMSSEEAQAIQDMEEDFEEWQKAPVTEASEEEMIERAEEHGLEHDPW